MFQLAYLHPAPNQKSSNITNARAAKVSFTEELILSVKFSRFWGSAKAFLMTFRASFYTRLFSPRSTLHCFSILSSFLTRARGFRCSLSRVVSLFSRYTLYSLHLSAIQSFTRLTSSSSYGFSIFSICTAVVSTSLKTPPGDHAAVSLAGDYNWKTSSLWTITLTVLRPHTRPTLPSGPHERQWARSLPSIRTLLPSLEQGLLEAYHGHCFHQYSFPCFLWTFSFQSRVHIEVWLIPRTF